eukprot:611497-Prorocentrum_minimum.AAC.1
MTLMMLMLMMLMLMISSSMRSGIMIDARTDEDDGGALLPRLCEQVAHARGPHPHKHLHEV